MDLHDRVYEDLSQNGPGPTPADATSVIFRKKSPPGFLERLLKAEWAGYQSAFDPEAAGAPPGGSLGALLGKLSFMLPLPRGMTAAGAATKGWASVTPEMTVDYPGAETPTFLRRGATVEQGFATGARTLGKPDASDALSKLPKIYGSDPEIPTYLRRGKPGGENAADLYRALTGKELTGKDLQKEFDLAQRGNPDLPKAILEEPTYDPVEKAFIEKDNAAGMAADREVEPPPGRRIIREMYSAKDLEELMNRAYLGSPRGPYVHPQRQIAPLAEHIGLIDSTDPAVNMTARHLYDNMMFVKDPDLTPARAREVKLMEKMVNATVREHIMGDADLGSGLQNVKLKRLMDIYRAAKRSKND